MLDITLILVEDDDELRKLLGRMLSRKITKLFLFSSPVEVLEKLDAINPDLIITDIRMPQMSGLEMIEEIRKTKKNLPIIISSAFTDATHFQKAIKLKVTNFLVKPIDVEELIFELDRIVENMRLNEKLHAQEKLLAEYKRIVDVSSLISKADIDGNITYVNDKFSQLSGYTKEELIGKPHSIVHHPEMPGIFFKEIWETILNKQIWQGIIKNRAKNGESYYVDTTIAPILNTKNEITEFISLREDVTKLINTIEEAKRLEKEREDYLALIDDNIICSSTDVNGIITSVSKAFCRISQYSKEELIGQGYQMLRHPEVEKAFYESLWQAIKNTQRWDGEIKNLAKDGSTYWIETSITSIIDPHGEKIGYTAMGQDVTDKKLVEKLSITDHLTGLVNRLKLDDILKYEMSKFIRYGSSLSIILVDIDYFKRVNDNFGHLVGDQVLKEVSEILMLNKRETDTVGRWGGEEFLIILTKTDIEGARIRAQKIRLAIESHTFSVIGTKTVSLGIAELKLDDTESSFVERADNALYLAKERGRNRVVG
ncbi:diguanylate cyclase [Sulfurimonas aquatica]|uniref:Diguanylate cyclase n=1 Tax=Sulfurimonas aquatica TaxID=2672570 RepID=A0A975AY48_9BACT|nr:diguanylate cyclase [Sulfurimonas aquatica]QSZ40638.1 diguanylate cyclase [Sulfurimonas aquatica]